MTAYIIRRLLQMIPVLILVSMVSFALIFVLPGDPARALLGEANARDEIRYQQARKDLGLDRPVPIQYLDWAARVLRGDLGTSTTARLPVAQLLLQRVKPTLELGILGLLVSIMVGVPAGIISAVKPNSKADFLGTFLSMALACIPHFWLGLLLILCFGLWLRWLPPSGYIPIDQDLVGNLKLMILPTITVAGGSAAVLMRQTRSAMLDVLRQDYVITARAKGLMERVVILRHALKNGLIPIVTVIGMQVAFLIGGAVVTESIFAIPGVGRMAADSIFNRDFPVLQAVVLVTAVMVLASILLTDIIYAWLDPRIRYS